MWNEFDRLFLYYQYTLRSSCMLNLVLYRVVYHLINTDLFLSLTEAILDHNFVRARVETCHVTCLGPVQV